ncbi:YceI family protein [Arcobacteraceae bacterium]|nr:YceI family protein [Arcobacteraceae bacterium]
MKKLFTVGLASLLTAGALYAGTYNIDRSHSNVGFKVKHLMITNVTGNFDKFTGSIEFDEKTKTVTAITGNIEASSINTDNAKRDKHLRAPDFFDTAKYPNLTFKLNSIKDDKAYGILTIKDVSKEVVLDFDFNGSIKDPWGNTKIGVELAGKINRKDFGLNWSKTLETGGLVVADKIKLLIEIEAKMVK